MKIKKQLLSIYKEAIISSLRFHHQDIHIEIEKLHRKIDRLAEAIKEIDNNSL